jgi:hypothetical protein
MSPQVTAAVAQARALFALVFVVVALAKLAGIHVPIVPGEWWQLAIMAMAVR